MKLKRCPLACAGEASYDNLYLKGMRPVHKVECNVCGCNISGDRFNVVDKWNNRDDRPDHEREGEFEEACHNLKAENNFLRNTTCS